MKKHSMSVFIRTYRCTFCFLCSAASDKFPVHVRLGVEHKTRDTHITVHKRRIALSYGFYHTCKLFTYLKRYGMGNHLEKHLAFQHTEQYFAVQF